MGKIITVPAEHVAAALLFSAVKDVRQYLISVCFESDGKETFIAASDGIKLFVSKVPFEGYVPAGVAFKAVVPTVLLAPMCKKPNGNFLIIELGEHRALKVTRPDTGAIVQGMAMDCKFPDWRRIIPTNYSGEAASVDPELMLACKKAFATLKNINAKRASALPDFYFNGAHSGVRVQYPGFDAISVVMPYRGSVPEGAGELPAFGTRVEEEEDVSA